jgi:hypothetical protein
LTTQSDLQFLGAEVANTRRQQAELCFADPKGIGARIAEEYQQSPFRDFVEAQRYLRVEIGRVIREAELADVKPVRV